MTVKQKPKPAATVILLRPAEPANFEVFLIRRPEGMAFLGGKYCFPGSTIRKEDSSPGMLRRCYGLTPERARKIAGAHFAPQEALGFWIAGVRELFEEVGILLAVHENEERIALGPIIGAKNAALRAKTLTFQSLLENEHLFCDLSCLTYFCHWQTPSQELMRFDTRFFLACLPADQSPLPSSPEVTHGLWLTPDRALELFGKNELPMVFPTFTALRMLADFDSLDSLFREYRLADT